MDKNEAYFLEEYKKLNDPSPIEILNLYRNFYYTEERHTERGLLANTINNLFNRINQLGLMDTLDNKRYSIVGYDKDNDVYVLYGKCDTYTDAVKRAEEKTDLLEKGLLLRECSDGSKEPIDWIEVYLDYGKPEEEIIWASYEGDYIKELEKIQKEAERMTELLPANIEIGSEEEFHLLMNILEKEGDFYWASLRRPTEFNPYMRSINYDVKSIQIDEDKTITYSSVFSAREMYKEHRFIPKPVTLEEFLNRLSVEHGYKQNEDLDTDYDLDDF